MAAVVPVAWSSIARIMVFAVVVAVHVVACSGRKAVIAMAGGSGSKE